MREVQEMMQRDRELADQYQFTPATATEEAASSMYNPPRLNAEAVQQHHQQYGNGGIGRETAANFYRSMYESPPSTAPPLPPPMPHPLHPAGGRSELQHLDIERGILSAVNVQGDIAFFSVGNSMFRMQHWFLESLLNDGGNHDGASATAHAAAANVAGAAAAEEHAAAGLATTGAARAALSSVEVAGERAERDITNRISRLWNYMLSRHAGMNDILLEQRLRLRPEGSLQDDADEQQEQSRPSHQQHEGGAEDATTEQQPDQQQQQQQALPMQLAQSCSSDRVGLIVYIYSRDPGIREEQHQLGTTTLEGGIGTLPLLQWQPQGDREDMQEEASSEPNDDDGDIIINMDPSSAPESGSMWRIDTLEFDLRQQQQEVQERSSSGGVDDGDDGNDGDAGSSEEGAAGAFELADEQVAELSRHMQAHETEHIRFSVHTTDEDGSVVELLNTGMMEICEFMDVRPGRSRRPRHGCSEILLDFGNEVRSMG